MKTPHLHEKQELARILTQNGQDHTEDLMMVLDAFLATEDHLTVAELHRRLTEQGHDYDFEFVEEALEVFRGYGFAQVKTFKGREPLYEHHHLGQHHDHLICTRCGRVVEFVNPLIEELQISAARELGFAPLDHRLEIYGLCQNCARVPGQAVPLTEAQAGEKLTVTRHAGGDDLTRRLTDLGLRPGAEVEVLGCGAGSVVLACQGSRLALGQELCEKLMVEPRKENGRCRPRFRHRMKHGRFSFFDRFRKD
jgi:Fur family ferric uptake transcriptional regulator